MHNNLLNLYHIYLTNTVIIINLKHVCGQLYDNLLHNAHSEVAKQKFFD